MLKKIGTYLFIGFLFAIVAWVLFCVAPLMVETAIDALKLWKEIFLKN